MGRTFSVWMVFVFSLVAIGLIAEAASAATHVLRPNATASQDDWAKVPSGFAAWENIDDPQLRPATPNNDRIEALNAGEVTAVDLQDKTLQAEIVNSGRVWFYSSTGPNTQLKVEVIWNGQSRVERTLASGLAADWRSLDLDSVLPKSAAAVNSLKLRFKALNGSTAKVNAAYLSLHTANLGFNESFASIEPSFPSPTDLASLAHAALGPNGTIRFSVDWREVWQGNWTRPTNGYNAIVAAGLRPLLVVYGTPSPYRDTRCGPEFGLNCPPDPAYFPQFKAFVAETATRFPAAVAIEVWNEPNNRGSWNIVTGSRGAQYANVFEAASEAVDQVSSSKPVLFGSLQAGPDPSTIQVTNHAEFLNDFYDNVDRSLIQPIDGLSLHPYTPCGPSVLIDDSRTVSQQNGDSGRALWMTEFGFKTAGMDCATSEAGQSSSVLAQMYALASQPDVEAALIHRIIDPDPATAPDWEKGFGLVEFSSAAPFNPKVAFCALAADQGRPPPGPPLISPSC